MIEQAVTRIVLTAASGVAPIVGLIVGLAIGMAARRR